MDKVIRLLKRLARFFYARFLGWQCQRTAKAQGKAFFFSIIIPVFNTEAYLAEAIESVL